MTVRISANHFSASSNVFGRGEAALVHIVREMAQRAAKAALSGVTDLTDNSGGTSAGNTLGAIADLTPYTTAGIDLASKTGWDTAWGKIRNGIATLAAQVNTIYAIVPAVELTDSTGGTSGSGTIAVIGNVGTAVASAGVSVVSANEDIAAARDVLKTLGMAVNRVAVACGEATINLDALVGEGDGTWTLKALPATSDASVDGTANSGVSKTNADAVLGQFANVIATYAAKLNACNSGTVPVTVVAV